MEEWFIGIPSQVKWVFLSIALFLGLLSVVFGISLKLKPTRITKEFVKLNNSWWKIAGGIFVIITFPKIYGTIIVAYISFVALREMLSISPLRASDRVAFFLCYLAIPVQYYLAHVGFYNGFIIFIPILMTIIIPSILVLSRNTKEISRSMSTIPAILTLTVFMPSHILMFSHLEFDNYSLNGTGILLFVIVLIAFNDVIEYVWDRLIGHKKILPNISRGQTWEGFLLGIISTGALAYVIRFLTPFTDLQTIGIGMLVGICGFFGGAILQAIKQDLQIKDTGEVLSGHGGVMDRLDSVVVAVPIYYHIVRYLAELS
jgi:phosphatidate cytidylyltransferase